MASSGSGSSAARRIYLSLYNWVVFFGWAQVLYRAASALLLGSGGHGAVYAAVEPPMLFAQTAAFMEILHSMLVTGRLYITWGIMWSFPEAQSHILLTTLVLTWSITEVIRYSFFAMKETFGSEPFWLLWLRYSTFLVLYPIGFLGEVGLIFVAMPSKKASGKYYLRIPNKWNLSFDYHNMSAVLMTLYVPGFPYLFRYMLAKRKKVLSAGKIS